MGIQGLRRFIKQNPCLLKDFQLCEKKLVIDGNNLLYHLFDESGVDYLHGGDYMQYAAEVQTFFKTLRACHVSPFIVFDGGHDPCDLKLQRRLSRARQRISDVEILNKVTPLLTYEVFRQVVDSFGIPFVVCDLDADHDAAVLANDMNCPLLSFDSDFFALPLKSGLIPFDTLDVNVVEEMTDQSGVSKIYLKCKIYFSDALTRYFPKLGDNVLILIATLLGNDYISKEMLFDFYGRQKTGPVQMPLNFKRNDTDIQKLFSWLIKQDDFTAAINEAVEFTRNPRKKSEVRSAIMTSVEQFRLEPAKCRFRLSDHFAGLAQKRDVKTYKGNDIPEWVKRSHETGNISMVLQNVVVLRRNIFMSQIEDIRSTSSFRCSASIRRCLYGILTSEDIDSEKRIKEIDRAGNTIEEIYLEPLSRVPKLHEIPNLDKHERQKLFLEALGFPQDLRSELPDDAIMLIAVMKFAFHYSEPSADENHVRAQLCCLFAINIKLHAEKSKGYGLSMVKDGILEKSEEDLENTTEKINGLLRQVNKADKTHVRIKVIHIFAQYQACFMAAFDLNQILMSPFPNINPAEIIHGSLLYSFYMEFEKKSSPDQTVAELLYGMPKLSELFNKMFSLIVSPVN